jgi:hypothetical protein
MAEQEQQLEEQQNEEQQAVEDQFAAADAEADPNEAPSVEEIASRMGWVPKEKFRGEDTKWKPADQFILDGNDIKSAQSRELKEMRVTLDNVAKTSGAIMAERLQQQHEALAAKYAAAVEKGDPDEAFKLSQQIGDVINRKSGATTERSAPDQATIDWVERNTWMKSDPVAAQRAIAICDQYARAGLTPADQVAKTEQIMRAEFPHLFPQVNGKAPPGVNEPSTRTATPQRRGKTANDLPKAARDVARDLVDRGLIKDEESYARNYFAQAERMQ